MRIKIDSVSASIGTKQILKNISLRLESGQSLALIGPNGSGKSTLLRVIAGLVPARGGSVYLGDDPMSELLPRQIAQRLGFVSQLAGTSDAIRVRDAVKLGRTPWLSFAAPFGEQDAKIVEAAMSDMAIAGHKHKLFNQLSGGEKQRVHIARVLAQAPQVFLLDEPTNHLDVQHQIAIMDWVSAQDATVVLALHDLNHAFACDRVAVLKEGSLIAFGSPAEVLVPEVIEPVFKVAVSQSSAGHLGHPVLTFAKMAKA